MRSALSVIMTTGNKVSNSRYSAYFPTLDCGSPQVPGTTLVDGLGSYYSRVWSGGDQPKTPKVPTSIDMFTYRIFRKNGTSYIKRKYVKRYPSGPRAPLVDHPFNCDITSNTGVAISRSFYCGGGKTAHSWISSTGNILFQDDRNLYWTSNDDIALINKLGNKLQGESFNMLVFLGESKESLQTITEAATRIARAYRFLSKGRVTAAAETLIDGNPRRGGTGISPKRVTEEWFANNWLQLQYGWKPLVSDIQGAAAHLAYAQSRDQVATFRAHSKKVWKPRAGSTSYSVDGVALFGKTILAKVKRVNQVKLLGLNDAASLVWEKLPYSFVFDWVIPVGQYLEALNLDRALTATYVISSKYDATIWSASQNPGDSSVWDDSEVPVHQSKTVVSRTVSTSLSVPTPTVKPWAKIDTWVHATNALALMANAVKSVGRKFR